MARSPEAETHRIDPSFRSERLGRMRRGAARRMRKRLVAGAVGGIVCLAAALYALGPDDGAIPIEAELHPVAEESGDAQREIEADLAEAGIAAPTMLDLPGDPLIVTLGGAAAPASRLKTVDRPEALEGTIAAPKMMLLSDRLLSAGERMMVQVPSSQTDFAFFQAQRDVAAAEIDDLDPAAGEGAGTPAAGDGSQSAGAGLDDAEGAGWGETVDQGTAPLPDFERTRIEDTTSLARLRPESERFAETEVFGERILSPIPLRGFLAERGFEPVEA